MPNPTAPRSSFSGRTIALALLVLVALIAIGPRFVRSDDAATGRIRPTPPPTLEDQPGPRPTPEAPIATPTPEAPIATPTPTPDLPEPEPGDDAASGLTTAVAEPAEVLLVGDSLVAADRDGIRVRTRGDADWRILEQPPGLQRLGCASVFDTQIAFTARTTDDTTQMMAVLDVGALTWSVSRLPRPDEDAPGRQRPDFCSGVTIEGQWVFATTHFDRILFATSSDRGSTFELRELPFAKLDGVSFIPISSRVTLTAGADRFAADICVGKDSRCGVNVVAFPNRAIAGQDDRFIGWASSGAYIVEPTPLYAGRLSDGLIARAAEDTAFEVAAVGDELWRSELQQPLMLSEPIEGNFAGRWAAGPIGLSPVPLPSSLRPRFFPYGDDVVAEVPTSPADSTGASGPVEWWRLQPGSTSWTPMERPPVVLWATLPAGTPVTFVAVDDEGTGTLVIPR